MITLSTLNLVIDKYLYKYMITLSTSLFIYEVHIFFGRKQNNSI